MEESQHHGGSVRTIRSSWNIDEVTIDVIELERSQDDEEMKISRAWVFHDDIFILLTEDSKLFTSVEVGNASLTVETDTPFRDIYSRVFTTLSTSPRSPWAAP